MHMVTRRVVTVAMFVGAMMAFTGGGLRAADTAGEKSPTTKPAGGADEAPGPLKFYGQVSAVDTAANTFTVGEQTFTIAAESQMTKATDDSKATLADAVVGQPARGTYTKSSDGKLTVTKVRFGKKSGGGKSGGKKKKDAATAPAAPAAAQ